MRTIIKLWANRSPDVNSISVNEFARALNGYVGSSARNITDHCEVIGFGETGLALVGTATTKTRLAEFEAAITKVHA